MNVQIGIHRDLKSKWFYYFKPKILNSITRKEDEPKIYKWLW